jgi:hypothetical protein
MTIAGAGPSLAISSGMYNQPLHSDSLLLKAISCRITPPPTLALKAAYIVLLFHDTPPLKVVCP